MSHVSAAEEQLATVVRLLGKTVDLPDTHAALEDLAARLRRQVEDERVIERSAIRTLWQANVGAWIVAVLQFWIACVNVYERKFVQAISAAVLVFVATLSARMTRVILQRRYGR